LNGESSAAARPTASPGGKPAAAKRQSIIGALWPWLAALTSGASLIFCFPRWNQSWLVWIALIPLICAAFFSQNEGRHQGLRKAALGYIAGLVFFTGTFHWLSTTLAALYENASLYALAPLVAMIFGCYFAFWTWFIGAVLVRDPDARKFPSSRRNIGIATAGAAAWVMHEWVREWLFGGFGWNGLGIALHRDLAIIQIADITGVHGLTFLIAFCNIMAVLVVRRIKGEIGPVFLKRIRWEFSFTMALIIGVWSYSLRSGGGGDATVPLHVAAIQPNIPQTAKFDAGMEEAIFEELGNLTGLVAALPSTDLVLWPESATPRSMYADQASYDFVLAQAQKFRGSLLVGTTILEPEKREDYNAAVLLSRGGQDEQIYRKMHLVPFGEYLPLRPIFSGFAGQLVPADFSAGREWTLLELPAPKIKFAALICFEDTLGDLTRRFVDRGAQALVNITNDGWFAQSPAAEQHLANAVFRAVENRRPLIRCGNTGVTCSIDPQGRVDRWKKPFVSGFAIREVKIPINPPVTFYTRHGNWLAHVCTLLTAVLLLRPLLTRLRSSPSS
jgi:apolipoprotein N-acyltransferase